MTSNELISFGFIGILVLAFGLFVGLIIFFALKNNTPIALKVDKVLIIISFLSFVLSIFLILFFPYDYSIDCGLPGDPCGEHIVLSYKIYLGTFIGAFFLPYSLVSNKGLLHIKTSGPAKIKLILLLVFTLLVLLIVRERNIISRMTYEDELIHFRELGFNPNG